MTSVSVGVACDWVAGMTVEDVVSAVGKVVAAVVGVVSTWSVV